MLTYIRRSIDIEFLCSAIRIDSIVRCSVSSVSRRGNKILWSTGEKPHNTRDSESPLESGLQTTVAGKASKSEEQDGTSWHQQRNGSQQVEIEPCVPQWRSTSHADGYCVHIIDSSPRVPIIAALCGDIFGRTQCLLEGCLQLQNAITEDNWETHE